MNTNDNNNQNTYLMRNLRWVHGEKHEQYTRAVISRSTQTVYCFEKLEDLCILDNADTDERFSFEVLD